ncbi:hypothetical protein PPERSA_03531 [Pseudocohnilembus persalinus]|uniref:Uncharacterized protein n=1 Tax=Pseudocohnilembus persalinus TaxID=266149 RepID=A0A0V0Q8L3_PSEPJ|nr:hypothetical protein PPERSA_03531 [Pseudocohnilembus persalinus]|eukprot:KRW98359.1 hypothetical protein PPERSA_03531 [Pseudocohnilembus persalinus]
MDNDQQNLQYLEKQYEGPVVWNCTKREAAKQFAKKELLNPFDTFKNDPYEVQTEESNEMINKILSDENLVCGIKYQDGNRQKYVIDQFLSVQDCEEKGYIVTHQGKCNRCSTLQDLSIYLQTDLTYPVAYCGLLGFSSKDQEKECLMDLGFTEPCAEIWYFNTQNTAKECYKPCMYMLLTKQPFVDENGNLNKCLQCDEDKSGPIFKYFAGRTRRNSGIESEIPRPDQQVYPINQCYY